MQSGWVRWIAYLLLAALVIVASCQAMSGAAGAAGAPAASPAASPVASLVAPFAAGARG